MQITAGKRRPDFLLSCPRISRRLGSSDGCLSEVQVRSSEHVLAPLLLHHNLAPLPDHFPCHSSPENPNLPSLIPLVILSSCLLPSRHLVILSVNFTDTDTRFGHECLVEKKLDVNIHEQRAYPSCATNIRLHANAKLSTIKSAPRWSLGGSFPTSVLGYPTKDNGLPPDTRS